MKLNKKANKLTISRKEWEDMGKKAGWEESGDESNNTVLMQKIALENADDFKNAIEQGNYKVAKVCMDQMMNALNELNGENAANLEHAKWKHFIS